MDRWDLYRDLLVKAVPEVMAVFGVDMTFEAFTAVEGYINAVNIICRLDHNATSMMAVDYMIEDNNVEVEHLVKQTIKAMVHDLQFARLEKQIDLLNLKEED